MNRKTPTAWGELLDDAGAVWAWMTSDGSAKRLIGLLVAALAIYVVLVLVLL